VVEVVNRFRSGAAVTEMATGVAVMVISLLVTGLLVMLQRHVVRRTGSIAIRSDQAHYATDFLVNFSVIAALVLSTQFGWWWIDPAIGLAIAIVIAVAALRVGRDALDMLMDREMDEADRTRIKEIVRGHPKVLNLHDLRTRAAGRDRFIQFHLEMEGSLSLSDAHRISDAVEADVRAAFPAPRSSSMRIRRASSSSAPPSGITEDNRDERRGQEDRHPDRRQPRHRPRHRQALQQGRLAGADLQPRRDPGFLPVRSQLDQPHHRRSGST
jgi:cation diffusion facilitator family transporter